MFSFKNLFVIALAVVASQISIRYFNDPFHITMVEKKDGSPAVGWSQLAFLRSQGQTGCLCCDNNVVQVPDANRGIHVVEWRPVDSHLTRNVSLPADDGTDAKITKELFQRIHVYGTTAGEGNKKRWWAAGQNDGYCIQACLTKFD